jgi:hypothetical protein
MRWLCAVVMAVAVAAPAMGSPASDAAYEAGRRHVEACDEAMGLALLGKAAAADPEAPSGHRARLLQILVLSAHVGRCLSALTSYDRGLQRDRAAAALRQQRDSVAEEGYGYLRQLLTASQGYRQHLPPRADCLLELAPPESWSLSVINSAEMKIEAGEALTPAERAHYESQALRLWLYMTLSQFYCRPGRDDSEVVAKVRAAVQAGERIDPWTVLATLIDNLAAVVNRSLLDEQMGRARVAHRELRSCVAALLLKAPPDEGIVARTEAEASVKRVFGEQRGAEWFHDMEFAARLVKAQPKPGD